MAAHRDRSEERMAYPVFQGLKVADDRTGLQSASRNSTARRFS
jgi:hypothetical protein